jgi:hypothetical protein
MSCSSLPRAASRAERRRTWRRVRVVLQRTAIPVSIVTGTRPVDPTARVLVPAGHVVPDNYLSAQATGSSRLLEPRRCPQDEGGADHGCPGIARRVTAALAERGTSGLRWNSAEDADVADQTTPKTLTERRSHATGRTNAQASTVVERFVESNVVRTCPRVDRTFGPASCRRGRRVG